MDIFLQESINKIDFPKDWNKVWNKDSSCLHDNCSSCDGTGVRKDGLGSCIHMISCPCKKCSPRMF
jgi:hypothetical protein